MGFEAGAVSRGRARIVVDTGPPWAYLVIKMLRVIFNNVVGPSRQPGQAALSGAVCAALLLPFLALAPAAKARPTKRGWELGLSGYGDLHFAWHDHEPNQNRPGGARKDSRLTFDTARFVLELEGHAPHGFEFEAELEIEHRGVGAAMELEFEEFGEFEQEIELGGEVVLEELYLAKAFGPLELKLGRFYVGVGLMAEITRPTRHLASVRPESETTVLPGVWDEVGLAGELELGCVELTAQVISGLDSTGFSSQGWISTGHQTRFELVSASDLAFVLRADWTPLDGLLLGASAYYGQTSRNRPKPDLVPECPEGDDAEVAPCGYVQGSVVLLSAHFRLDLAPVFAQGTLLWGHLENADAISERNARLSNNLDVLRSPIADEAFLAWFELGVDLGPSLGLTDMHLTPFFRFDYYDTMFTTAESVFDNPRFARAVYTAGLAWRLEELVFAKLDLAHRDLGGFDASGLRDETSVRLAAGFTF